MNRNLILIRHTKSNRDNPLLSDFDRPIVKERMDDPKNMARHLKSLGLSPDLILCSPAKRTRQTGEIFCHGLKYEVSKVIYDQRLYESSAEEYLGVIRETDSAVKTLILVGHNPSITNLANTFIKQKIQHVPTTGVVWIELHHPDWQLHPPFHAEMKYFLTPKTLGD